MKFKKASIVIILKNNKEFLSVSLHKDHSDMNMPGGMVEKNETPEQAAIREVKEETGLEVKNLKSLYQAMEDDIMVYTYYTFDYEGEIFTVENHKIEWLALEELNKSKSWPEYNKTCYELIMKIL
jgi:8-oxo-dGTP diphosphatase